MIRDYTDADRAYLQHACAEIHRTHIAVDPWRRGYIDDTYAENSANGTLKEVAQGHGKIFVAEVGGKCVGMVAGIIKDKDLSEIYIKSWREGEVLKLFVDKPHRGGSIARDLMDAMEDFFKSKDCVSYTLELFGYNDAAEKFYSKCGLEPRLKTLAKRLKP